MQITCKLKFAEKQLYRKQFAQYYLLAFFSKHFRMTIRPLKIATKIIFISRQINLSTQNLKIIPYNQKKKNAH